MLPPLLILTGPTAVGKTALALELAENLQAEIVCADSRTVYRGMNIATAKPTPAELARVPHHLIDVVQPDEEFTLPDFLDRATSAIEEIRERGHLPLLVGGTVLYINALLDGREVPRVSPDPELRRRLEQQAAEQGLPALYQELIKQDPAAADYIDPSNLRRIVRALEVYYTSGELFSHNRGKTNPRYRPLKLALTLEREALYERADRRVEQMFQAGLEAEVQRLLTAGYSPTLPSMSSVGYAQVARYLAGEISLAEAKAQQKWATHRYIRHQYTWFRRDPEIKWLDATDPDLAEKAHQLIKEFQADL